MKIAIVTGGSSGIGRSVAFQLARRDVGVLLTYHRNAAAAEAVVADIARAGGSAAALRLDLADGSARDRFVAEARPLWRSGWRRDAFDFLVNNAGVGGGRPFAEVDDAYFDAIFAAN